MAKHGWKEGQSLGNRESVHVGLNDTDRLAAARVGVLFKDDNLGLGAKKKSNDVEAQRTGLDAFQGLLGRLNGKSETELKEQEKKVEDRKLAMYAKGKWGGMVFVRGGVLVGDREEEKMQLKTTETKKAEKADKAEKDTQKDAKKDTEKEGQESSTELTEKQKKKEEKRRRKEEKARRREEKALKKAAKKSAAGEKDRKHTETNTGSAAPPVNMHRSPLAQAPDEPVSSASGSEVEPSEVSGRKRKRRGSSVASGDKTPKLGDEEAVKGQKSSAQGAAAKLNVSLKNGRHLLRGRNIQAKKAAFSDLKGLDEIFMRPG
ncbi:Pin2-interacting protein X1 [Exophiala dermatitidis NIH/UT8656]|uniref:Pin2-interacting protein X1 n=2 Tax=Exophiala dermatitidis TaxID=5970 RepID=H6BLL5_EXODN|nr:Pin2-interacting protein X1 [Exophiala dermatitidis NIH/UT8656]EHY51908.1 Pin2-interacting protein X1 [Exophiala dermatitidis NIH/UT8656]